MKLRIALLAILTAISLQSMAVPVTVEFGGTLHEVVESTAGAGSLTSAFNVGDRFTGSYTFNYDPTVWEGSYNSHVSRAYELTNFNFTLNSYSTSFDDKGRMYVSNNVGGYSRRSDVYEVKIGGNAADIPGPSLNGFHMADMNIAMRTRHMHSYPVTDGIPTEFPHIGFYIVRNIVSTFWDGPKTTNTYGGHFRGTVDQLGVTVGGVAEVPEPTPFALFGMGLLGLMHRKLIGGLA